MDWWLTRAGRNPIGPVSTELILKGIGAGLIPRDCLVCEFGGTSWRSISTTVPFSAALSAAHARRASPDDERTVADPPDADECLSRFDETVEHTIADRPRLRSSIPPRLPLERFQDNDEKTVADAVPSLPSEPPDE